MGVRCVSFVVGGMQSRNEDADATLFFCGLTFFFFFLLARLSTFCWWTSKGRRVSPSITAIFLWYGKKEKTWRWREKEENLWSAKRRTKRSCTFFWDSDGALFFFFFFLGIGRARGDGGRDHSQVFGPLGATVLFHQISRLQDHLSEVSCLFCFVFFFFSFVRFGIVFWHSFSR